MIAQASISSRNIPLYYLTQFLHSLVFTIPIWIVYYQARITVEQISFLVAFQYAFQVIGELPSGALADLIGRRKTIILGFLLGATSFLMFPFADVFLHFMILASLIGLSDSFLSGAVEAIVFDSLKEDDRLGDFKQVLAKQGLYYQIGLVTATMSGGFLFALNQFLPYIAYGTSLGLAFLLSFLMKEPHIDTVTFTFRNYVAQMKLGTREAFKDERTRLLSIFYIFVGAITWSGALYFNAFMMVALGFSDVMRGLIDGGLRLVNISVLTQLLRNESIFTYNRSILFFPVLMLFAYLPGYWLSGWLGVPFVAAAMMASTARWIVLGQYTNEAFESKYRATAISALSMLIGFLYIALTFLSGPIMSHITVKGMYTILGLVTLVTVVPIGVKLVMLGEPLRK